MCPSSIVFRILGLFLIFEVLCRCIIFRKLPDLSLSEVEAVELGLAHFAQGRPDHLIFLDKPLVLLACADWFETCEGRKSIETHVADSLRSPPPPARGEALENYVALALSFSFSKGGIDLTRIFQFAQPVPWTADTFELVVVTGVGNKPGV
jgi:hypothetical protein